MEVIAAGSAILPIAIAFMGCSKQLYKYAKQLKYAQKDVQKFGNDTEMFATLLRLFHTSLNECKDSSNSDISTQIRVSRIDRNIERAGRDCLDKLRKVLTLVRDLRHGAKASRLRRLKARVRWFLSLEEMRSISLDINMVCSCASLLMIMVSLDKLLAQTADAPGSQDIVDEM